MRESYGYLDDQEGAVFDETLERARERASLIQIVTWNDFGEGTIIEPTTEFGYHYLEALQNYRKKQAGKTFPVQPRRSAAAHRPIPASQQAAVTGGRPHTSIAQRRFCSLLRMRPRGNTAPETLLTRADRGDTL